MYQCDAFYVCCCNFRPDTKCCWIQLYRCPRPRIHPPWFASVCDYNNSLLNCLKYQFPENRYQKFLRITKNIASNAKITRNSMHGDIKNKRNTGRMLLCHHMKKQKKNFALLCLTCCACVPHSFELKTCTSRNAEEVPGGVYLVHEGDSSGCHFLPRPVQASRESA